MAIDGARSKRPISANISRVFLGHHIAIGQYAGMDFPESQRCSQCKRHTLALSSLRVYGHDVVGNSNGCIECSVTNGHRFQDHAGKDQFPTRGTCGRRHLPDDSQCSDQGRTVVDCFAGNGDPPGLEPVVVSHRCACAGTGRNTDRLGAYASRFACMPM